MALLIDQLAAYLQTQGQGTVGVDIFKVHRPATPANCISLHPTGGYPPDNYTTREHPTVMVHARAATRQAALRKAYSIFGRLHGRQQLDLGDGVYVNTVRAVDSPTYIGEDGQAHLASFNLVFDLRRPSS